MPGWLSDEEEDQAPMEQQRHGKLLKAEEGHLPGAGSQLTLAMHREFEKQARLIEQQSATASAREHYSALASLAAYRLPGLRKRS